MKALNQFMTRPPPWPGTGPYKGAALKAATIVGVWAIIFLLVSIQIDMAARVNGKTQPLSQILPSSFLWCALWALLTPTTLWLGRRFNLLQRQAWPRNLAIHILCGPLTVVVNALLFVVIGSWLAYGQPDGSETIHLLALKLSASMHFNLMIYALIVGLVALKDSYTALRERESSDNQLRTQLANLQNTAPPSTSLIARAHGRTRIVPLDEIDWLGAAGAYVEVHMGERTVLIDGSLTRVLATLPVDQFARIHRTSIVRLDRVIEITGTGRGDAWLALQSGQRLKLSRRYRDNLAVWLKTRPPVAN
ncbi:hypothetical protein AEAC466_19000 [Asticcacaulis sp. AC466]|uniref:LytR/AlgR family response regulator transcription factor n=1 Tax=Asticcacaulis sp. AC466 TaxID=1282362 RepID=UPI0003C3ECA5|nr:LytTR family DNA-binding domain-containing protein [Asticcacaulis sp. AC466]ESQ82007.1 hypothetical protein AEAC466_19000 [Asticcacaulis sp. AC466]